MWNIVSKISTLRQRSAVIITTHSMEEAEALCTKMGIMVAGEFKCFGSSQHIKDKFGTGYELEVKIRTLTEKDVNERLKKFNIASGESHIGMNEVKTILAGNEYLLEEIRADGLGAEFFITFA
jgi:ATP-binding cassette subfamily A (ABC1) protein 3